MASTVDALDATLQKTHLWLKELVEEGHFFNEAQAYSAFRAVMHVLRDRLTVDEGAHLAAQLPMLIRGMYYEGWKPSSIPSKERTKQGFYDSVGKSLTMVDVDPAHAVQAVFQLLERKITAGELNDVKQMLPPDIRDLWP